MLSIIIPVYNIDSYIEECLNSLLKLNRQDYEIICINDGSTDNSLTILNKWAAIMPNLVVIDQENKGLSAVRNRGLQIAKGEYIAFLDGDDYVDHSLLSQIYNIAIKNNVDIAVGDFWEFDDNSENRIYIKHDIPLSKSNIHSGIDIFINHYKQLSSVVWRNVYKKSFLIENKLYFHEGIYFEDVEFTPIAFSKASKVICPGLLFYYYRKRNNSITTSITSEKKVCDAIKVWQALNAEVKKSNSESLTRIFHELGFHCFLNQYSMLNHVMPNSVLNEVRKLCTKKMKTYKYILVSSLLKILPDKFFHKLLRILR